MATIVVRAEKRDEFLSILSENKGKIKEEEGCEDFEIFNDLEDDNTFCLIGVWRNRESFIEHTKSNQFAMILAALKLLKKTPELRYFSHEIGNGMHWLLETIFDSTSTQKQN